MLGYLQGLALQGAGALHGFSQAGFVDGFQEIIHGAGFECFHGMLIESGDDNDDR